MRRRQKVQWFLTTFVTLTISGSYIFRRHHQIADNKFTGTVPTMTESYAAKNLHSSQRHVTKSMNELGKMDEINRHVLFVNNVPKCGSEILILLLQKMQGRNNFRHVRLKGGNRRKLTKQQQENLVYEVQDIMKKEAIPLSFDRSVYFVNFTTFDKQSPTFVNIVRDPIDKAMSGVLLNKSNPKTTDFWTRCMAKSKKNCNYKTGKSYDLTIPYFCGQDPRCMILNDEWALNTAKMNVEKYYPVVGVLEELNATLEVLENRVPYFFRNAHDIYRKEFLSMYKRRKLQEIPVKIRRKLRESLIKEYEFYEWLKTRLFQDLQRLYGEHHNH